MRRLLSVLVLVLFAITLTQCTKEGPRGPQGPAGADGVDGTDGTDGVDGNANVKTFLFTNPATIEWDASNSIYLYYGSVFSIPDSIRDEGVILIYMQYSTTGTAWYFVPGLQVNGEFNTRIWITETFLRIYALEPDGSPWTTGTLHAPKTIKVVLIPGTDATIINRKGNALDVTDYYAVKEYFNLEM